MKKILVILLVSTVCGSLTAQFNNDTIQALDHTAPNAIDSAVNQVIKEKIVYARTFGGYNFFVNGDALSSGKLYHLLQNNRESLKHIKKARTVSTFSQILGYASGYFIGFPVGTLIAGGKPNWSMLAIGGGLLVGSFTLGHVTDKNIVRAIDIYNNTKTDTSSTLFDLRLTAKQNGVGLLIQF